MGLVGHSCPFVESLYGWSLKPKGGWSRDCVGHPQEADNREIITTGILNHQQWGQVQGLASRDSYGQTVGHLKSYRVIFDRGVQPPYGAELDGTP